MKGLAMLYGWVILLQAACAAADAGEMVSSVESAPRREALCQAGASAPTTDPNTCLFGEQFGDIRSNSALSISGETWIRSTAQLSELEAEQVLRAMQQSSHSDVTTPAEALSRVDQQEVRRLEFYERSSGRTVVAMEYGAGDNSYGAIFPRDSYAVVASIHDGDLLGCAILPAH